MTTKLKIIVGFTLVVLLMGMVAILGYTGLEKASGNFEEYRRRARLNVALSDMLTNVVWSGAKTYDYAITGDDTSIKDAATYITQVQTQMGEAEKEVVREERKTAIRTLSEAAVKLGELQQSVGSDIKAFKAQYTDKIAANGLTLADELKNLAGATKSANNIDGLALVSDIQYEYGLMLVSLGRFSESRDLTEMKGLHSRMDTLEASITRLSRALYTESSRTSLAKIKEAFDAIKVAFTEMERLAAHANTSMDSQRNSMRALAAATTSLNTEVDGDMRETGTVTLESNSAAQNSMSVVSLVGTLVAVAIAAFIIVGIVRVLGELSHFAGAIAHGNFGYGIKTREKGEIGEMVSAMQRIPAVLTDIIAKADNLASDITVGKLRNRLNEREFEGSFSDLSHAVNTVGDAFTVIIDALPLPVTAADTNFTVAFSNTAGQQQLGSSLVNGAPQGAADNSFAKQAMQQNKSLHYETTLQNGDNRMDLSVTAVPLTHRSGASAGFIEIITDLTEVRAQQRVMMQVAKEASEISNRVAAASEELASQVEQISRGAELQRSRVESTASAMTEMNATVLEVARSAGQASEQSDSTRQKAEEGAGLVNQVMGAINAVNAIGQNLQVNMEELGKQAESIGGVMNVISDIADQTNLLALNAAIEAARAGEAGRGFAVVADEVRKLAEKTMEATQEVGSNITAVQTSARVNIEEVGRAVSSVSEANGLANSSGDALRVIVELAAANSAVVASIATAAEEQSATSEEINRAIDEINQVVGETSEGMIQSSAAVQELSHMAQELRRVMEGLK